MVSYWNIQSEFPTEVIFPLQQIVLLLILVSAGPNPSLPHLLDLFQGTGEGPFTPSPF